MKCKILVRPSGHYNAEIWPDVGEEIDLPDHVAEGMARSGNVKIIKTSAKADEPEVEKRPASQENVETRKASK